MRLRRWLLMSCVFAFAAQALSHIRLHNPSNGASLFWQTPGSISIVVQSAGSDDIPAAGHLPALRMAIDEWNDVTGTTARLVENVSPLVQSRTDWNSSTVHLMYFDENNSSGFFPNGSGTVAVTPVSFFANGRISDADVLFNGGGFSFTTSGTFGAFDVQDVAAHELGHLLGLDHTAHSGATMYPYVNTTIIEHRSVSADEVAGMRASYPSGSFGAISGTVRRASDSSTVAGAYVVARDVDGRPAGGALAEANGTFVVRGLTAGDYELFATPLDSPVSSSNLTNGHTVVTDFQPVIGAPISIVAGAATAYGDLLVGADVALTLGRNFDTYPLRCTVGQTSIHSLHGTGLGAGCVFSASDPRVTVAPLSWIGSTQVVFEVTVPNGTPVGHVDLSVDNGNLSVLVGAIELTPEEPIVTQVTPSTASPSGGVALTIQGTGFAAGARVVIGETVYEDGALEGCTVVDDTTITLTTIASSQVGTFDVVVLDDSGVEGRANSAFTLLAVPQISLVFPTAGSDLGGSVVTINGSGFSDPMIVRIDGVMQSAVTVLDSATVRIVTEPGVSSGAVVLELEDSDGDIASAAFTYVPNVDPVLADITPNSGPKAGGAFVTITGVDFAPDAVVSFGANPNTGLGGTPASSLQWIDAQTFTARTPARASGTVAVMVSVPSTGQATVMPSAYTFEVDEDAGGGGCSATLTPADPSFRSIVGGSGWLPALALILLLRRRRVVRSV